VGGPETTAPPTTLPARFYTVVLGSFNDHAAAVAARDNFRGQGVRDATIVSRSQYPSLGTAYAVCSGQFADRAEADAHRDQLLQGGLQVTSRPYTTRVER
jgi:cell division protein FtsN